jgi:UDP-N-acetylmuramoylalanine--D-glutamate ligase
MEGPAFRGRAVAVLGAARSGLGAAKLLAHRGATVTLWDERPVAELGPAAAELAVRGVVLAGGVPLDEVDLGRPDLVVVSPGVPLRLPSIARARAAGCPVWGEVELAGRFLRPGAAVLGVTGTNGKSTTTALLGALCEAGGLAPFVGGNLGTPFSEAIDGPPRSTYVLELSSFQLEGIEDLRIHGAAVLNLTPDHLDRYDTLQDYARAKARIFRNQEPGDVAVVNADDPATLGMLEGTRAARFAFTAAAGRPPPPGISGLAEPTVDGFRFTFTDVQLLLRNRALRGAHNRADAMAAALLAFHAGVKEQALQAGLDAFPGLAHRLESVRVLDGVEWVNDSKATNVDAVLTALAAFPPGQRLWLIAGGKGKGAPYAPLVRAGDGKVAGLLTVGQDGPLLQREFAPVCPVHPCETLERAVARARELARPGEVVLLSPACASYDQFRNFEHRGEVFKALVGALR